MLPSELACPRCGGALCAESDVAVCDRCTAHYRITNGIPDFRVDQAFYDGPIPRERLRSILHSDSEDSWADTVGEIVGWLDRRSYSYLDLVGSTSYPWVILLGLCTDARVLEVRCGTGGATEMLARCATHVFAMDMTFENLTLARRRLRATGVQDKVTLVAAGDTGRLPFRDGSIDHVILVGGLERAAVGAETAGYRRQWWSPTRRPASTSSKPAKIQIALLAEACRVLKPGGGLFLGAENRYYYNYFGRLRDRVTGLRCISLLPRVIANAYSLVVRRQPYLSYSYSEPAYRRLLQRGGFVIQNAYVLSPDVRRVKNMLPIKPDGRETSLLNTLATGVASRNRLLAAGYGFDTRKAGASASDGVTARPAISMLGQLQALHGITYDGFISSTCPKCIIFGSMHDRKVSIKVPLNDAAAVRTRRNYVVLEHLSTRAGCSRYLPAALDHGVASGFRYYIESFAYGRPLRTALTASSYDRWLLAIAAFLDALNPGSGVTDSDARNSWLSVAAGQYALRMNRKFAQLADKLRCHELVARALQLCRELLSGLTFQGGTVHGDLSVDNIMIEAGEICGVIDWDDASRCDLPLFNAYNAIDCMHQCLEPDVDTACRIRRLATWDDLSSGEHAFLKSRYERWRIDPAFHYGLVYLYWMQHSSDRIDGPLEYDVAKLHENYVVALEQFIQDASGAKHV